MNVGSNGEGVRNVISNTSIGYVYVDPKFGLEAEGWPLSYRSYRTHVKDVKNPVQVRPPGSDCVVVVLMETPRDRVSFTTLYCIHLDLGRSCDWEPREQITLRRYR